MSDERPPPDDWLSEDPFSDPEDPAARERAERRAEREQKRREKAAKEAGQPPPPAEPPPTEAPKPKRTPEQEFWDEDPTPAPAPPSEPPPAPPSEPPPAPEPGAEKPGSEADPGRAEAEREAQEKARPAGNAKRGKVFGRRRREPVPPPPVAPVEEAGSGSAPEPPTEQQPAPAAADREPRTEQQPLPAAPAADRNRPAARAEDQWSAPEPPSRDSAPESPADRPPGPPSRDRSPEPPTGDHAQEPPTRDRPSGPSSRDRPPEPPTQDPAPEPVPVGADPTRPATGEHLIPDPRAPDARGQTSEEWAAVPAARADALDEELHEEGDPTMAGAARTGRRRGDGGGNGRGGILGALARHPFRIAAVVIAIIVLWFLNGLFEPFHGDGHGRVAVRIPKGASVSEVGDILEKRGVIGGPGLIDASTLFQIRVTLAGKRSDLYAGHFTLQKDMSYGDAIDVLSQEPSAQKPGVTTVTIPEGYTRRQAAQLVREDGVPGNYEKATVKSKYLDPAEYGGKDAKNLEGFLFPNTFELKPKAPVKDLVQLQLQDFKKKIKKVNMKYAKSKNLTVYDVVTIASMIEDEAGVPKQRKLVASVIYNRLREGIPLGIDATIRFATGNYARPLTVSELETDTPYNTRLNAGLPPGPINSPGLAALRAAAHPKETEFIYYVNDPDSCNELTFAKTDAEFEAAVQKYEQAREANGGNAPSTCGE